MAPVRASCIPKSMTINETLRSVEPAVGHRQHHVGATHETNSVYEHRDNHENHRTYMRASL